MRSSFDPDFVDAGLITCGQRWAEIEFHEALGSTNDRARALAADPGLPWQVVVTDHQTGGRGRLGRTWQVPDRASVAVSALVPLADPATAGWAPLLAGVALQRAIAEVTAAAGTPLHPMLKWPNDVLIPEDGNRKVSGILCELVQLGDGHAVIIGTGVNVHQTRDELPVDTATSLDLCGARVRREDLVVAYLRHLGELLRPLTQQGTSGPSGQASADATKDARAAYLQVCSTIGARVRVQLPASAITEGTATGIDASGALLVETAEGLQTFAAGDVVHVRPHGEGLA